MNPLKASLSIFALCLIVIMAWALSGCAGQNVTLVCQDYAVAGAHADRRAGYPVMIYTQPYVHSQHKAQIEGEWVWRCVGLNSVYTCDRDNFNPTVARTINDFVNNKH